MLTGSLDQAREYLARVVPWPQDANEQAWVNVHWTFRPEDWDKDPSKIKRDKHGKELLPWGGRAVRSVSEAINVVQFQLGSKSTKDIYLCLSSQAVAEEKTGRNNYKYHVAVRDSENAIALKSIFLDLDYKGADKDSYASAEEASAALVQFLQDSKMPRPSLMVSSGGGFHVYWTFNRALTVAEWAPLAFALAEATKQHGLKCDTQCTIDAVRVLRIPDTRNFKSDPPRPVSLFGSRLDFDYTPEHIAGILEPYKTAVPQRVTTAPLADLTIFPPKQAIQDELSSGVVEHEYPPIKLTPELVKQCGFIREALTTGGKDFTNPLWNLTTLLATFIEDGRTMAHLMGRKHRGYTELSTDELFDRKERERDRKGLGWPSCATISGTGSAACQTCPHFAKGKTPLHLSLQTFTPATVPVIAPPAAVTNDLPKNYKRDANNLVCRMVQNEDGTIELVPLHKAPMSDPTLQRDPWTLNFTTMTNKPERISIPFAVIGTGDMRRALQEQGMGIHDAAVKGLTEFFVNWVEHLKSIKGGVVSTSAFGWNLKDDKIEGFAYGGRMWTATGDKPTAPSDPIIARQYQPCGSLDVWRDVAAMILNQENQSLAAILASSFAAPLMRFTGEAGVLMSVYSVDSGIGKTTAMRAALAVWGNPHTAMQGLDDTTLSVGNKIGALRTLPVFWDELKTEEDTKRFVNLTFRITSGREKSRLTSQAKQREAGVWKTMLISASNAPLIDAIVQYTKTTPAGLYRVFEFEASKSTTGFINTSDASRLHSRLDENYGQAGLVYSKFLGEQHERVDKEMGEALRAISKETKSQQDERFWIALVASVYIGAKYANELGLAQFDEVTLKKFMLLKLASLRKERSLQSVDMSQPLSVSNILTQFLAAMRARHTLTTNQIWQGRGKPGMNAVITIGDHTKLDAIYVQVGRDDKMLRMSKTWFMSWLKNNDYPPSNVLRALEDKFQMRTLNGRLGSGTPWPGGNQYLLEIDLSATPHANFLDEA